MRKAAIYGLVLVCVWMLFARSGPSAQRRLGGSAQTSPSLGTAAQTPKGALTGDDVATCAIGSGTPGVPPGATVWSYIRAAMALESQAVAALEQARAMESAASTVLLEQRGEPTGGDPSRIHALDRVGQAARSALQAENILCRSLDDLAAALADLPAEPQVSEIVLSRDLITLVACTDTFDLTATVFDTSGNPLGGVPIFFFQVVGGSGPLLILSPSAGVSGPDGQVRITVSLTASCEVVCGGGNDCSTSIVATTGDSTIVSAPVAIIDNIL